MTKVILGLILISLSACATYRLDTPFYTTSNARDAIRIYVEPYHFVGGWGGERLKGDWNRDEYMKTHLTKVMPVIFVDSPQNAVITVITKKMWINASLRVKSETMINGQEIETCANMGNTFSFVDQSTFNTFAHGDAALIAEVIARITKGQNIKSAYADISRQNRAFSGIENVQIE